MKKLFILFCFSQIIIIGCKSNKINDIEVTTLVKTTESWNGKQLPNSSKNKIAFA